MAAIKLSYTEAVAELEQILASLEKSTEVNMDIITKQVKRAAELMEFCKAQLHNLDAEMEKILANLGD
jgi:exodeoxyribonuclease VII small subunit